MYTMGWLGLGTWAFAAQSLPGLLWTMRSRNRGVPVVWLVQISAPCHPMN
jgi:hypothetical protein